MYVLPKFLTWEFFAVSVKMKKNEEQPVLGKCTNMM